MNAEYLNYEVLGNTIRAYLVCASVVIAIYLAARICRFFVYRYLQKWAEKTATTLDDFFVEATKKSFLPFLNVFAFYAGLNLLTLHALINRVLDIAITAMAVFFCTRFITMFVAYGFKLYLVKKGRDTVFERSLHGILIVIKAVVWCLAVVFILDNIGFKISTVIAGLGIGGVAVALAAQAVLKDLFSYFSILFDRPFEVGDFIIINDYMGTVEYIGVKTTRLRSLSGEQVIFANADLTDSRVRNYKRMEKRRVVFTLGIVYDTPLSQIKAIPHTIEKIIKNTECTLFDRAHFSSIGNSSLLFEIVYFVMSSDYNKYMDVQQKINIAIIESFGKEDIQFAFPTQTIHVQQPKN